MELLEQCNCRCEYPGRGHWLQPRIVTITCTVKGLSTSTTVTIQPSFTTRTYQTGTLLYLENDVGSDVVLLGMDTSLGGAVSQFSLNGVDVVAKASYGSHLIAVGLYDGHGTYDSCNGCTGAYGWNPVESCDSYRHGSPIIAQEISPDTIYIKTNALEWIPDNKGGGSTTPVPSDIMIERWFSSLANHPYVFHERYEITHIGSDRHANASNEVPSYEISAVQFNQFDFYTGTKPGNAAPATVLSTAQLAQYPAVGTTEWLSEYGGGFSNQQGTGFAAYSPQAFPYATPSQANEPAPWRCGSPQLCSAGHLPSGDLDEAAGVCGDAGARLIGMGIQWPFRHSVA